MINEKQDKEKQIEQKHDEFDDMLDAALAKYAAAEPRAGLDERVLANLRAERARVTERACWRWSIVAPLARSSLWPWHWLGIGQAVTDRCTASSFDHDASSERTNEADCIE